MTAEARVALAAALYLGFETKVSCPGEASSMAATPVISVSEAEFSRRAFRAVAMSESFMAFRRIVAEGALERGGS